MPQPSVTVRVTRYVPAAAKVRDGLDEVLTPPSPKFQEYEKVSPVFGSLEVEPLKLHTRPTQVGVVITADGGRLPLGSVIVTGDRVTDEVNLAVTVRAMA